MNSLILHLLVSAILLQISSCRRVRQATLLDDSKTEISLGNITTEIFNITDDSNSTKKAEADDFKNLLAIGDMKKCRAIKAALMKLQLLQSLLNCASCAYGTITLPLTIFF